ncbi:MAG: SurA N-terminal domain-containing protein, partial [Chitinophagaceae bacterium]|nr:SurA N-terminal domain-containing protein [Chitinophagaceae bacterium]
MSIVQKLQNKYSAIVVTVLVISLIGFLVMDGIQSNVSNLFSRDNTLMASINGERIDAKSFQGKLKTYEDNVKARSKKTTLTPEETSQIREQLYNDLVNEKLLNAEIEKLGLDVSDKEFQDMLTGEFVDPQVRQSFTDPKTGIFDPNKVREYMAGLGYNPDQ